MTWNYRGYARSKGGSYLACTKGMPSPEIIREDSEEVLRYCRNELGLKGKIGVYGRSLGGIATAHLAHYVDMVIVDRSFSNLYEVAFHKFYGMLAVMLFKLGTAGWDSNNDVRFCNRGIDSEERQADMLKKGFFPVEDGTTNDRKRKTLRKNCYKVITCDANDDIVILQGSLMVGVARQAALAHQKATNHYKDKPLGILDDKECQ